MMSRLSVNDLMKLTFKWLVDKKIDFWTFNIPSTRPIDLVLGKLFVLTVLLLASHLNITSHDEKAVILEIKFR